MNFSRNPRTDTALCPTLLVVINKSCISSPEKLYYILVLIFFGGSDMQRNTSVTLGDHFSNFIKSKISQGRYDNTSEAVRAGLRLLEVEETKLEVLRAKLAEGEAQLDKGQGVDGQAFMDELIG